MDEIDFEKVPGTWAYELKQHWDKFDESIKNHWNVLNKICKYMNDTGNEGKVNYFKWREYMLWDMQRRHDEEVNGKK